MKLIVGLGNPGRIYRDSRHNIGFSLIVAIARAHKFSFKTDKGTCSLSAKGKIANTEVILAMPLTFMNLSGIGVAALLKKYKVGLNNLLVICDDLDLSFGRLKIRAKGSSGGHRGLASIIDNLEDTGFARLRIGIGRPDKGLSLSDYVLSGFTRNEKAELKNIIHKAADCCLVWVKDGIVESMNIFNQR